MTAELRKEKIEWTLDYIKENPVPKGWEYINIIFYYGLKLAKAVLDRDMIDVDKLTLQMKDHIIHGAVE